MKQVFVIFAGVLLFVCTSFTIAYNSSKEKTLDSNDFETFLALFPTVQTLEFNEELFTKLEEGKLKQISRALDEKILGTQNGDDDEPLAINYAIAKFEIELNKVWGFIVLNNESGNSGRSQRYYAYTFNNTGTLLKKEKVAASFSWDGGFDLQTGKLEKVNGIYKIKSLEEREDEENFLIGEEYEFTFQKDGTISKKANLCFILPALGEEEVTTYKTFEGTTLLVNKIEVVNDWKYYSNIEKAIAWKDNNGDNYVFFTSQDAATVDKLQFGGKDAAKTLHAVHYVVKNGNKKQLWEMNDFEPTCEFDLFLNFIYRSLELTDLDKNGVKEISFMYSLGCISDVSPVPVKLMLYDNGTKYPLRGMSRISSNIDAGHSKEPSYKADKAFDKAPSGFLDFAKKQWVKYDVVY